MRIKTLSIGLLLFVVLAVHPVSNEFTSEEATNTLNEALPELSSFISTALEASPAASFLVGGLGLLHVLSVILNSDTKSELTKTDLLKTQKELMNKLNDIDAHISDSTSKIINELSYKIESHATLEEMRNTLESFNTTYKDKMHRILDSRNPVLAKRTIGKMLDYYSTFRTLLRSFITTYIKPTVILPTSGPINLFFDYILKHNELLTAENQDCNQDSLHYKIFKSYIYIAKVLTDAYVMVLSAHVVQYQDELRQSKTSNAEATRTEADDIIESFKNDMKVLMDKTKWALENSSREIKNCGSFELKEGKNYARLPFVTTIPKFKTQYTLHYGTCIKAMDQPISLPDYEALPFNIAKKLIPPNSYLEVYYNPSDLERPLSHVKFGDTTLGHADGVSSSHLTKTETGYCNPDFYYAYNYEVGISTQRVCADPGNVITGVRFRVRKNVLYVDIQQGKFISDLEVDPSTVHWKETPEDDSEVTTFTPGSGIVIADYEVKDGKNLTAFQFVDDSFDVFGLHVNFEDNGGTNEMQEIKLNDRDDPAKIPADAKRLITKHPDPNYAYIQFQSTSFKKDLSRTTIPYIDTREVVTNPPSPVIGIGIYHEAAKDDGGLLALKLIQPRLTKYVDYSKLEKMASPESLT